jgi:uncharacterized protein (TIGR02217 family)
MFNLRDSSGYLWSVNVLDNGDLTQTKGSLGSTPNVYLNDPTNSASFQIGITIVGGLTQTSVTFNALYPESITLISPSGLTYGLFITLAGDLFTVAFVGFPVAFPVYPTIRGKAWPVTRTQMWENQVQRMSSGAEVRIAYWANPLKSWEIRYGGGANDAGYIKDNPGDIMIGATETDMRVIEGFYNQMQGRFGVFLFDDVTPGYAQGQGPWDSVGIVGMGGNPPVQQSIGTGDGSTTTFQLVRTIGGFTEAIQTPFTTPAPNIYLNAVLQVSGYSINQIGQLIFTSPPGSGVAITGTYGYYWPCRFSDDSIPFDNNLLYLWAAKSIKIEQCRL